MCTKAQCEVEREWQEMVVICLLLALHLSNGSLCLLNSLIATCDLNEGTNSDELTDMTSDVTEWLSSLPDVQSVMDFDKGGSTFVSKIESTENKHGVNLVKSTKR